VLDNVVLRTNGWVRLCRDPGGSAGCLA
jgi:hypothetical protein